MAHEPNWKYAQKVGPDMTKKEVVEVYDDYYGRYEDKVCDSRITAPKPSFETKKPFSGGGKR